MDGLPAMKRALEAGRRENVKPIEKMVGESGSTSFVHKYRKGYYTLEQAIMIGLICMFIGFVGAIYGPFMWERHLLSLPENLRSLAGIWSS